MRRPLRSRNVLRGSASLSPASKVRGDAFSLSEKGETKAFRSQAARALQFFFAELITVPGEPFVARPTGHAADGVRAYYRD